MRYAAERNWVTTLLMSDIFTTSKRSDVMSRIRSTGNRRTELAMMTVFRECGVIGWRRGQILKIQDKEKLLRIRPDFIFRKVRVAVFVDGEFWHGHPTRAKIPITRREWWLAKIEGNRKRDRHQSRMLRREGWTVVRIWQHELTPKCRAKALRKLREAGLLGS